MIHCTPVDERRRSFCSSGTAIETIVMSMKVIATAKIIAVRTSFLFGAPLTGAEDTQTGGSIPDSPGI